MPTFKFLSHMVMVKTPLSVVEFSRNFNSNVAPLNIFQSFSNFGIFIFSLNLTTKKKVGSFDRVLKNHGGVSSPYRYLADSTIGDSNVEPNLLA